MVIARKGTEVTETIRIAVDNKSPSELLRDILTVVERGKQGWRVSAVVVEVTKEIV